MGRVGGRAADTDYFSAEGDALRIGVASPAAIRAWSSGEVASPDLLDAATGKPVPGGLLCERIFGPYRDWECGCGRLKGREREGRICRACGVRVGRSDVRRERMGHVELATPVAHPWFLRGAPGRIATLLDCPPRALERVVAHDAWLVLAVDTPARDARLADLGAGCRGNAAGRRGDRRATEGCQHAAGDPMGLLATLRPGLILTEAQRAALDGAIGLAGLARLGTGGAAVREALATLDLDRAAAECRAALSGAAPGRRVAARLRLIEALRRGGVRPEWLILTVLPILPADLRPVVPLSGGRFAASDLNELYGRVIARNNRLKELLTHRAPEPILRNERRLLQAAVDALIDNGRLRAPVAGRRGGAPLQSLSDRLRGKGGRLRRNLLGKRVDYSARSVIAVGPTLRLGQCGLPARLALELFKPFVMREILAAGLATGAPAAKRLVERADDAVWPLLARAMRGRVVLLNRAPTLHMGSLQAFDPILLDPGEGDAIRLHPLACAAFNADFDGDQMAVHLPLSAAAQAEARALMHARTNLLSAASGAPAIAPGQDIVLGCYYLTMATPGARGEGKAFADIAELELAYEHGAVDLGATVLVRLPGEAGPRRTTAGRVFCHEALRAALAGHGVGMEALGFRDEALGARALARLLADCHARLGGAAMADLADALKDLGFRWSTRSGLSVGWADLTMPPEKETLLAEARAEEAAIRRDHERGILADGERRDALVALWSAARDRVAAAVRAAVDPRGAVGIMVDSGARGNANQLTQLAGMRGLITDASGRIIPTPITANYREGIPATQYFMMSSGARKGATDRALRTADAGYLTRRLVDVAQDVLVTLEDCGTVDGLTVPLSPTPDAEGDPSARERLIGRYLARPLALPGTGERCLPASAALGDATLALLFALPRRPAVVAVRSPLRCAARRGICRRCYGLYPATGRPVALRSAVGVVAAQSIGEPGTQLTMKTFQLGGVASATNITGGLPRVEELFEAIRPRGAALLAPLPGLLVEVGAAGGEGAAIALRPDGGAPGGGEVVQLLVPPGRAPIVAAGARVVAGQALTDGPVDPHELLALAGRAAAEAYLVGEVAGVYRAQGVGLDRRHVELVVRRLTGWATVEDGGDTAFLPGEVVASAALAAGNAAARAAGRHPATARATLLGVTRAALASESFLAAAGFQETTGVLADAALARRGDPLRSLKARAFLGRRIPS